MLLSVCWIVVMFFIGWFIICCSFLGSCGIFSSINIMVNNNKKMDDMVLGSWVSRFVIRVMVVFGLIYFVSLLIDMLMFVCCNYGLICCNGIINEEWYCGRVWVSLFNDVFK